MIVVPTVTMLYCSHSVYSRLHQAAVVISSDRRMQARLKRNQSITRTLFGIILMFLLCHTGKVRCMIQMLDINDYFGIKVFARPLSKD